MRLISDGAIEITEDMTEDEYRLEEYKVLIKSSGNDVDEFHSINYPIGNYDSIIHKYFKSISLVPKLKETRAFVGVVEGKTLTKYVGQSSSVIIPEGITGIGDNAFSDNQNITK